MSPFFGTKLFFKYYEMWVEYCLPPPFQSRVSNIWTQGQLKTFFGRIKSVTTKLSFPDSFLLPDSLSQAFYSLSQLSTLARIRNYLSNIQHLNIYIYTLFVHVSSFIETTPSSLGITP